MVKNPPANADVSHGFSPGAGRSPGGGCGTPLQCYCLENSIDRGAWQANARKFAELDTAEVT